MMAADKIGEVECGGAARPAETRCRVVEVLVAAAFGVPVAAIRAPARGKASVARARQVAMYLAHVGLGLSLSEIGRHFGRDRTTVAHACGRIEDCRDDNSVEAAIAFLEEALEICMASRSEIRR